METAENKAKAQSNTNVYFPETEVNAVNMPRQVVSNSRRNIVSFRADESLYFAFKEVAKRKYGSVCKAFEAFMVGVVWLDKIPDVNKSSTIVLNQTIQRNLSRERRNLSYF